MTPVESNGYYADCYVLVAERNRPFVRDFLDRFLPVRSESADEYEVPQYSDKPTVVFKSADELLDYVADNPKEEYAIYWRNEAEGDIRGAMCFPTNDGRFIIGLYCVTKCPDTSIEDRVFGDLKIHCSVDTGYIAYEEDPPRNSELFSQRSMERNSR
jgi:hypothetical protein